MKMTPSEIRAGMRRAAEQLGEDTPEGLVVRAIVEKLDARFQHAGGKWFEDQPPGITDVQVDKIGYYLSRRELKLIRAKAINQAKTFNLINAGRRTKRNADIAAIRAHKETGGSMQIKVLQKIRGLHGNGKRYLSELRKEI